MQTRLTTPDTTTPTRSQRLLRNRLPQDDQIRNTNIDRQSPTNRATARTDKHFRYWPADDHGPKLDDLAPGTRLIADSGFACLGIGEIVTVRQSARVTPIGFTPSTRPNTAPLFVACKCGRHYLTPDEHGRIDGFTIATNIRCAA